MTSTVTSASIAAVSPANAVAPSGRPELAKGILTDAFLSSGQGQSKQGSDSLRANTTPAYMLDVAGSAIPVVIPAYVMSHDLLLEAAAAFPVVLKRDVATWPFPAGAPFLEFGVKLESAFDKLQLVAVLPSGEKLNVTPSQLAFVVTSTPAAELFDDAVKEQLNKSFLGEERIRFLSFTRVEESDGKVYLLGMTSRDRRTMAVRKHLYLFRKRSHAAGIIKKCGNDWTRDYVLQQLHDLARFHPKDVSQCTSLRGHEGTSPSGYLNDASLRELVQAFR